MTGKLFQLNCDPPALYRILEVSGDFLAVERADLESRPRSLYAPDLLLAKLASGEAQEVTHERRT